MKDKLQVIFELIRDTARAYVQDKAPMLAASLAYYMIISLAPLLILTVALASVFVGEQAIEGELVDQIEGVVGEQAAVLIQGIIENASQSTSGVTATIISTILLLLGASGVFAQLKRAINSAWGIVQPPDRGFWFFVKTRILAFVMVIAVGALLIASFVLSTTLGVISQWLADSAPVLARVLPLMDFMVSLTIMVGCFALVFKFVPDAAVSWQDVGLGAGISSSIAVRT